MTPGQKARARDATAVQFGRKLADEGLDFGQFGHERGEVNGGCRARALSGCATRGRRG